MAKKNSTIFVCSECGYESSKWLGKCPACNNWNTFYEEKAIPTSKSTGVSKDKSKIEAVKLNEVKQTETVRIKTGLEELDRVLGGGFVSGSLTLLGGEPGIGKSTLILQICKINVDLPIPGSPPQ
jgi:DNA repair protein RadA/Sms